MSEQLGLLADVCRRQQVERRQVNMRSMFYALFMSRRRSHRRASESVSYYCDQYGPYVFAAALLLMLMCILDSYFTLILIQHGSTELNPILAWALEKHVFVFFLLKYTITALCVIITVVHKHFQVFSVVRLKGAHFLFACLLGYGVLIQYQLTMLIPILS